MLDYYFWIIGVVLFLVLAGLIAKRRMSKIDHLAPEHRAKEEELYVAFGLETPPVEKEPKDHELKQQEVEAVFSKKISNKKEHKK